ncbi:unnamed protein product [Rotaria sordida]|uniref:Cation/H+ exchanger transmembrane domain-containing protein n=1 Tax=Rotaria sordida TaxID=392033 RepID=A0A815ER79_9BILA|nr:unnamed protein product [Rotaria sordida]
MIAIDNSTMNSHHEGEHTIGTMILFLSFAVLAGCICKLILSQILKNKFPAPFTVIVLIFGFTVGMIIGHINVMSNDFLLGEKELREINPHLIYYIFLPLLIFNSAFNSHFHVIRPQIISAILLAGPGVFISIVTIAVFAIYIFPYHWSWLVSIMFGSILSATDPVAVVALLHESGASKSLAALIDLESLLNDGSAFVIFTIFRDIVVGGSGSARKIVIDIVKFTIGTPESERILLQALEHMRRQTMNQLHKMKQEKQFSDVDWNMLNEYLPDRLVQKMDEQRNTTIHQQFSVVPSLIHNLSPHTYRKRTITNIEFKKLPSICETDSVPINFISEQQNSTLKYIVLPVGDFRSNDKKQNINFRNELIIRFLTALLVDYEKQWHLGMIRRRTLYILIKSIEKAKHQHSLKLHWKLIVEHFRLSKWLQILMQFDCIDWINNQTNKLLFDHIFLTIELTLAFHSARTRMDNIQKQFPELANIDERIWHEVCQETHFYHLTASYILLDLQQSYEVCWRIHMTKRCAQILLKYELKTITELYETGMLGNTVYSHILELIEKKLFNLEFYRVQMPKGHKKAIEDAFDLLPIFQSLPLNEKTHWQTIMKAKHRWFQPDKILLRKSQRVFTAYLIVRGIVECKMDTMPIYYRSGNIVGIDALFSQNVTEHGTYFVSGGLLEAYSIDAGLLDQFLNDENLAPSIYREIALHLLSNKYQARLKLNRLQLRLLVHERAKFYWKQSEISIQLKENQRLFILAGNVIHLLNGQNNKYDSIQLQIFDTEAEILLNPSTVAYSWTDNDEEFCIKNTNLSVHFPLQTSGLLSTELLYPGYSGKTTQFIKRQFSASLSDDVIDSIDV